MKKNVLRLERLALALLTSSALVILSSGCSNVLSELAQTDTEDAVIYEAKKLMDRQLYTDAITQIETLSATVQARRDVLGLRASAYAGRCGLNFLEMVDDIQSLGASTTLFNLLLGTMKAATDYTDCRTAEDLLEAAGATAAERATDENLLLAFVSFSKIGAILAASADDDNDGVANAAFDACTGISDTLAGEIGTGLSIAIASLQAAGSGVIDSTMSDLAALCTAAPALCAQTDPANYSAIELAAIKTAIHDDDGSIGLGTQPSTVCTP